MVLPPGDFVGLKFWVDGAWSGHLSEFLFAVRRADADRLPRPFRTCSRLIFGVIVEVIGVLSHAGNNSSQRPRE
jgi:hypothetical protein